MMNKIEFEYLPIYNKKDGKLKYEEVDIIYVVQDKKRLICVKPPKDTSIIKRLGELFSNETPFFVGDRILPDITCYDPKTDVLSHNNVLFPEVSKNIKDLELMLKEWDTCSDFPNEKVFEMLTKKVTEPGLVIFKQSCENDLKEIDAKYKDIKNLNKAFEDKYPEYEKIAKSKDDLYGKADDILKPFLDLTFNAFDVAKITYEENKEMYKMFKTHKKEAKDRLDFHIEERNAQRPDLRDIGKLKKEGLIQEFVYDKKIGLHWTYKPTWYEYDTGKSVFLGRIKATLGLDGKMKFIGISYLPATHAGTFHLSCDGGTLCLGTYAPIVEALIASNQIPQLIRVVWNFIHSANAAGAAYIPQWKDMIEKNVTDGTYFEEKQLANAN